MDWFELEIQFLISDLPDRVREKLANKEIHLNKKTLQIWLDTAEEAVNIRDLVHPAIARLIREQPGKYEIEHIAYVWNGGKFKIPLILPSLRRPATSA